MRDLKARLSSLALMAGVIGMFIAVIATRNREDQYAPKSEFIGCYSNGAERLLLGADGGLTVNGAAAGSYRIVKPVGGKHGYLVEAHGLTLARNRGAAMRATPGSGGFLWPVDDEALDMTFAPDVNLRLTKVSSSSC